MQLLIVLVDMHLFAWSLVGSVNSTGRWIGNTSVYVAGKN